MLTGTQIQDGGERGACLRLRDRRAKDGENGDPDDGNGDAHLPKRTSPIVIPQRVENGPRYPCSADALPSNGQGLHAFWQRRRGAQDEAVSGDREEAFAVGSGAVGRQIDLYVMDHEAPGLVD